VFFCDADYELYCDLLALQCRKHGVPVWGYCLMPNHVRLILAPGAGGALPALRAAETIGRPLGSPTVLEKLAATTGRDARPKPRGPKPMGVK
jgi:hypothetical protein